jgi:uracil-DNA glycosylase
VHEKILLNKMLFMKDLKSVHLRLKKCRKCPDMCGNAVFGPPLKTQIMLVGQAPGIHEGVIGKPFAYTAGKTLFKWLKDSIGAEEEQIREMIYFSAVARCFPGKAKGGKGDRPPSQKEIENCSEFLKAEVQLIKPQVILAVGKLAIAEVLKDHFKDSKFSLEDAVGKSFKSKFHGRTVLVIPLPHPSGVSRWPHSVTGKEKLKKAFDEIARVISPLL